MQFLFLQLFPSSNSKDCCWLISSLDDYKAKTNIFLLGFHPFLVHFGAASLGMLVLHCAVCQRALRIGFVVKRSNKIITNKNASIKYLENIINKASKEQKPFVSQAVTDLKQLDKFSGIVAANILDFGIDDSNAEEPVSMQGINTEQEVQKIKQQFYRQ